LEQLRGEEIELAPPERVSEEQDSLGAFDFGPGSQSLASHSPANDDQSACLICVA
jgi:hypothetical protein